MRVRFKMLVLLLALLASHGGPARAEDAAAVSPGDRAAITGVISRQIEAFRSDDAATAFGQASPTIQAMFGTPANFMAMVKRGYAPLYRPRQVEMRDLISRDGQVIQRVEVVGPDGVRELAQYAMERGPDGGWHISGCQLTRSAFMGV